MRKGIKAKDIRDFEECAGKLNAVMKRIRGYCPEAYTYATPGELHLMAGFLEGSRHSGREEQEEMLVTTVSVSKLEAGDW